MLGHVSTLRESHATEGELLRLWRGWRPKAKTIATAGRGLKRAIDARKKREGGGTHGARP